MYAAALEGINREQLATATDRLLFHGAASSRPRAASPQRCRAAIRAPDRRVNQRFERTVIMRRVPGARSPAVAIAVALPSLFGLAFGLTALL